MFKKFYCIAGDRQQGSREEWPDPSDPAYQVPAAVYEEPAQPKQQAEPQGQAQREGRPTGAHPGYEGGLEGIYGGGSLLGNVAGAGANATVAPEASEAGSNGSLPQGSQQEAQQPGEDDAPASNVTQAAESMEVPEPEAAPEQGGIHMPEADAGNVSEPEETLTAEASNAEEAVSAAAISAGGIGTESAIAEEPAEEPVASSIPNNMASAPAADTSEDVEESSSNSELPRADTDPEDAQAEVPAGSAPDAADLDQADDVQQGQHGDMLEDDMPVAAEEESPHLPREGTLPDAALESEEVPEIAAEGIAAQEEQQKEGLLGRLQQQQLKQTVLRDADGLDEDDLRAAAAVRADEEKRTSIFERVDPVRWPEEGPSRPNRDEETVQLSGGVGMSGEGTAAGSEGVGGSTGKAADSAMVTGNTDSNTVPEMGLSEELLTQQLEGEDDGVASTPGHNSHKNAGVGEVEAAESEERLAAHEHADDLAPDAHVKDEL